MSKQLELDINRPSWADTDFHSEMKDLWNVRRDTSVKTGTLDVRRSSSSTELVGANAKPLAQQHAKSINL